MTLDVQLMMLSLKKADKKTSFNTQWLHVCQQPTTIIYILSGNAVYLSKDVHFTDSNFCAPVFILLELVK